MGQTVNHQHRKNEIDKSKRMVRLLDNIDFQELILEDFITKGIVDQTLRENIDNTKTIDQLKARQILHSYLFGIISTGEVLNSH